MGIQLTAFSGHRPRYVGRPAVLISLALQQTVARKKATCPSAIDYHPKSEGPIFVSMTASELFIDGQFRTVSSVEPVTDAVTEQVLGEGPDASLGDIDEAVGASRRALPDWSATPAAERAHLLERFTDALAARAEDTSQLCSRETGAPMSYGPAPHTAHNLARGCFIGRPYAGAEAEIRVIGGVDGIGVRLVRNHRCNRSARDTERLDYSEGVLPTGFQQSASFLRILSGLRT